MHDAFKLVAAGDAILNRRLRVFNEERFTSLVNLVRAADLSVVNLETLLHDFEGYPAATSGGTYMRSPPWVADELAWAGFDACAAATNHAFDYSHDGMIATMRELDRRAMSYAGLGESLTEARAPAYVDTPAGRCGLISACSTIVPGSAAGKHHPVTGGRPGIAPLRLETRYQLPEEALETLQSFSEDLGLEARKAERAELGFPIPGHDDDAFRLLNLAGNTHPAFETGDSFGVEQRADESDIEAFCDGIREANRQADWVVASLHAHEGVGGRFNDHSTPAFLESFARRCIDAGADAFVGHGPHVLRGIEVYHGAPIFYSLGNFLMQNETVEFVPPEMSQRYGLNDEAKPADVFDARIFDKDGNRTGFLGDSAFWESVLPVCTFDAGSGALEGVRLYPLDLGYEKPRSQRGRPMLASGATASEIVERLADLSAPYGTTIVAEDDHACVVV
ncbi:CapA family protein [Natronomonas sp.]|uniref:CapA family protein n=1 Tax=Natronomonas sp. TaxID=2184060 RepID=UPI0037CB4CF2